MTAQAASFKAIEKQAEPSLERYVFHEKKRAIRLLFECAPYRDLA